MSSRVTCVQSESSMLLFIQVVHTAVAAWNYYCLCYMIYCHATGRKTGMLVAAYVTVAIEAAAILPFKLTCPLRLLVDRLTAVGQAIVTTTNRYYFTDSELENATVIELPLGGSVAQPERASSASGEQGDTR